MKIIIVLVGLLIIATQSNSQETGHSVPHKMQHGFVLSVDDQYASHLVATGHHSRQVGLIGQLSIIDPQESDFYHERKLHSLGQSYFLFQAQDLDLPTLSDGQTLAGHIVESRIGDYSPKNKVVKSAIFKIEKVLLNVLNPFFNEETQPSQTQP